jgi:hypothetical protein
MWLYISTNIYDFMTAGLLSEVQEEFEWCLLRRVALVRTDVSEERSASFIRVTRIGVIGTTLAVTSNRHVGS